MHTLHSRMQSCSCDNAAVTCLAMASVTAAPANVDKVINDLTIKVAITNDKKVITTESLLLNNGLFEGDLKISEDFIRRFYNISGTLGVNVEGEHEALEHNNEQEHVQPNRRAAIRNAIYLWEDGIVPYQISQNVPSDTVHLIQDALNHWQNHTCLRFTLWSGEVDYVEFDNADEGCFSNSIGKSGGKQTINLQPNNPKTDTGCEYFGKIVHEIGHAVGFWHEQSRPDRDSYVSINLDNVQSGEESQFMKRSDTEVDSRGIEYDYGSIMHYGDWFFLRDDCKDCKTITITNDVAYSNQGSPRLGQENGLSTRDIMQANTLYSCPNTYYGVLYGSLKIYAHYGRDLPNKDFLWNKSDPYIEIAATDQTGHSVTKTTSIINGNQNPTWNEWVEFDNCAWAKFSITVYDSDSDGDDPLSDTVTWSIGSHGYYAVRQQNCYSGYVVYDFSF